MADIYQQEDESFFGPINDPILPDDFQELPKKDQVKIKKELKSKKECIKKGKNRIMEKTKEIRQSFSKAVISGSRSGSGKVVFEHYDSLVKIWGGSANSRPLPFGISSSSNVGGLNSNFDDSDYDESDYENSDIIIDCDSNCEEIESEVEKTPEALPPSASRTGKRKSSIVPKLIDNKRKHLEKTLSAAQRDQLMKNEMKGDAEFRQDLSQPIKESNATFSDSLKQISQSMADLSKGLCTSMELLSRALSSQIQPRIRYHNIRYHNIRYHSISYHNKMFFTN